MVKITQQLVGGHLYVRLDIIFVKGLLKHTLNMYFSGMKIDPINTSPPPEGHASRVTKRPYPDSRPMQ